MGILFTERSLTGIEAYERENDPNAESEPPQVLRLGYRFVVAGLLSLALILSPSWLSPTAHFTWSHWPWFALLPVVLYLMLLVEDWEFGPLLVAGLGILVALQLDGVFSTIHLLSSKALGTPIYSWAFATALIAIVSWRLGRVDRYRLPGLIWASIAVVVGVALMYIVYRALTTWLAPEDLHRVGKVLGRHWPPIALAVSLVTLAARFTSALRTYGSWYEYSSGYYLDPDYYDPSYSPDEEQSHRLSPIEPAVSTGRSVHARAQWLIRVIAAVRNTGLNLIDAALILVTLLLLAITILYYVPDQIVAASHLSRTAAARSRAEERRTALAMLAALGAGFTLVYTHLRHQLDRDASTSTRFADGVTNMATESLSTRLGGIYSLGQVARQSQSYADNVVEVLSAFTCESTAARGAAPDLTPVTPVTIASLRVLNDTPPASRTPDLSGMNLSHATLDDLRCRPKTNLADANFVNSRVVRASLERVALVRAQLRESHWSSSNLRRANLESADLESVTITSCNLEGANLVRATLRGARLSAVNLAAANLHRADLRGAVLSDCSLHGAQFSDADLRGCDLRSCKIDIEDVWDPVHDAHTQWPQDFDVEKLSERYPPRTEG